MGFTLFKKRADGGSRPSTPPGNRPGTLCFAGCGRSHGWQCSYVDTHGAECHSWWCPEHVHVIDGAPFCRRHSAIVRMLVERVGSIFEVPPPRVDDRALPLLLRLAESLDQRMIELLKRVYAEHRNAFVDKHGLIRERKELGRHQGWECVWSANSVNGYLTMISLRVNAGEPPVLQLLRDGRMLREGTPPWIDQNPNDTMQPSEQSELQEEIFQATLQTFTAGAVA
ncbi:MAG TPA: hypothetical protein VF134_00440 [Candidatus Dormibacteraeota bacterium]